MFDFYLTRVLTSGNRCDKIVYHKKIEAHLTKITVPCQAAKAVRERRWCRRERCGVRFAGSSENIRSVVA